jgi:hypothetical protein
VADDITALIRDLDKAARDASSHTAFLSMKFRQLMESDDPDMPPRDAVDAENGIREAVSGLATARRILGKRARLLSGPPPRLMLGATGEAGQLDIIARTTEADLIVGRAIRSGSGEDESWSLRLTDAGDGTARGSIGLHHPASLEEVLEALGRFMDDHGPWWAPEDSRG